MPLERRSQLQVREVTEYGSVISLLFGTSRRSPVPATEGSFDSFDSSPPFARRTALGT